MAKYKGSVIAYSRILAKSADNPDYLSIGRVCNSSSYRGIGIGQQLLSKSIRECEMRYGAVPIKIGAQLYLQKFYESFGFVKVSDVYLEDGIPHIYMIRRQPIYII